MVGHECDKNSVELQNSTFPHLFKNFHVPKTNCRGVEDSENSEKNENYANVLVLKPSLVLIYHQPSHRKYMVKKKKKGFSRLLYSVCEMNFLWVEFLLHGAFCLLCEVTNWICWDDNRGSRQIDRIELIYYAPLKDKGKNKFRLYLGGFLQMEGRDSLLGLECGKYGGNLFEVLDGNFSVMSEPRGNEKTVHGARINS